MVHMSCALTVLMLCVPHFAAACQLAESVEIEGSCFWLQSSARNYNEAKMYCEGLNGVLAFIKTASQFHDIFAKIPVGIAWIGVSDENHVGLMTWEYTGDPVTELDGLWDEGEPSFEDPVNCAVISANTISTPNCGIPFETLCMERDVTSTISSTSELTTSQSETSAQTTQPATTVTSASESTTSQSKSSSQTTQPATTITSASESTTSQSKSSSQTTQPATTITSAPESITSQSKSSSQTNQPATAVNSAPESSSAQSDTSFQPTYTTTIISSTIESSTKYTGSINETIGGFTSNARVLRISIVSTSLIYVFGNLIKLFFTIN